MPKLFYDGTLFEKFGKDNVVGFTTNTSICRQGGITSYSSFYNQHKSLINNRPISFQIFSDDPIVVAEQAKQIVSIGPNIYAKVPIINSKGESLLPTIMELLNQGVWVNITAIFTMEQINAISEAIHNSTHTTPTIVSVFAGRISDTGIEPKSFMSHAVNQFKDRSEVEILWAGVKDNLVMQQAKEIGCHIVTCPDAIMTRLPRIGQKLDNLSQESVVLFLKDAVESGIRID
jgi:transaldolase